MRFFTGLFLLLMLSGLSTAYVFNVSTYNAAQQTGNAICYDSVAVHAGNLVQIIKPGADTTLSIPSAGTSNRGAVGGDDVLIASCLIGDFFEEDGQFMTSVFGYPVDTLRLPNRLYTGQQFYVRVWCNPNGQRVNAIPVAPGAMFADGGPFVVPASGTSAGVYSIQMNPSSAHPNWTMISTLGVSESSTQIPTTFSLASFPNPFNSIATITYSLPKTGKVSMVVYDVSGRTAATLLNTRQNSGQHSVKLDATGLSSGTYFVRLQSDELTLTRKIVLLR